VPRTGRLIQPRITVHYLECDRARLSIKPIAGPTAAWIGGAGLNVTAALDAIDRHEITALFGEVRNMVSRVTGFA
jgi:hypothetical protein